MRDQLAQTPAPCRKSVSNIGGCLAPREKQRGGDVLDEGGRSFYGVYRTLFFRQGFKFKKPDRSSSQAASRRRPTGT